MLWRRALTDPQGKFHCLVMGDLLDYDVSQKAADCLHTLIRDYDNESNISIFGLVLFYYCLFSFAQEIFIIIISYREVSRII